MPVETHEVICSFDQPGDARHPLLSMLQQLLNRPLAKDSRAATLLGSQRVLIIDSQQERAQYIAQFLKSARYWAFVVASSLDAYTLFLQGTFHPFVVILCEEGAANNQFFLTRLAQQFVQRYDWNIPFIRLQTPSFNFTGLRSTGPLTRNQPIKGRPTLPLYQSGELGSRQAPARPRPPAPHQPEAPGRPPLPRPSPSRYPSQPLGDLTTPFYPARPLPPSSGALPPRVPPAAPTSSATKMDKGQVEKIPLNNLTIGRYYLKSVIGGNPIGDVYLAYDRSREQDIALKTIQTPLIPFQLMDSLDENYNLFQPELDLLRWTEHSHLAHVTSIGKSHINGSLFVYKTMPYYQEGSLANWLQRHADKQFQPSDIACVILQIASALQFLHNRGLLYQNFKQSNLLIINATQNMHDLHIALADLPFVQDMINLPKTIEAYRYYAPEQWENEAFTSSDQYGLAVLTYELLTGSTPFQGNSEASLRRMHLTIPAPAPSSFNSSLSLMIDKVILRALSKRPEERFESVSVFAAALEQAAK